ncbi:retrovirus-related pol polyprotein from transposon TNT 1-94 [Tanacetum coccineum]
MAAVNDVPQLVDKNGGSYSVIAPKLDPGKFNKWKKQMLCYLARMEPYYLKCIKDGPFQPKTAEGDDKPKSQWTADERRVVVQDQRLKSIIMSCLPDDIMKSVISCVSAKETWTDLVHSFEDIYGRFVYEDNLIQRRYSDTKKAFITTPSSTATSTTFFSNNVIQNFQENSDDEVDERSSEEYLRDLDIEYHERALLENSKLNNYSSVSKGFQPKFTPKLIQSSPNSSSQTDQKFQKDYKAEYKKMKAKLALLEASPSKVSKDEEVTQVKVLMALADDELIVGKSHARNVKNTEQESKLNEVTKLVQMLIDEKVNSTQKIQESNSLSHQTGSSKILYCMICKREDHRTLDHEMYIASLKKCENYKAQPYQDASPSKQILKAKANPFPPCTHCGFNDYRPSDCRNYPECEICRIYDHFTLGHNRVILIRGGVLVESSQSSESSIGVKCNTCESTVHSTTNHNDFDHFKRDEKIQATKTREPTKNGCSKSMTGVKSYLHQYVEQPGPKVVFGDNPSCITEGYGLINCEGIFFTKVAFVNGLKYSLISISQLCDANYIIQFDDKQGTIFNANKEIVLIAPRRNDVYVLDMSSLTPNGACFFAKASESINWLWHKRLSHLNFKNINKLAKQNKVLSLPSLVYSKDKPYSTCEKKKHHRASFKTKQNFLIRKCLHLLHMDLFGPVNPISITHEKKTRVIIDEYSRERIPDISYFHVFGCPVFIHNHKDHHGKFDAKADDGYCLGYSSVSKAFIFFNTRRQQIEETYHVTCDESMEAIRFTNTSVDEIRIDDSSRYPPDEFLHEDDPSRQYQVDSDVSYYNIPHGCSLTELT